MRSIGEPIFGRDASDISMARLLAQLLQITEVFDMHLQPQLVLLQKTMVVVEGVARTLDPHLDIWKISQPIVETWMERELGPEARLRETAEDVVSIGRSLSQLPETLRKAATISAEGVRLHPDTVEALGRAETARNTSLARSRMGRGRGARRNRGRNNLLKATADNYCIIRPMEGAYG